MLFSTNSLVPATQHWPWLNSHALSEPCTAASKSASANTMFGLLPPSSSDTFFRLPFAASTIFLPTSVEPVNATLSTSSCPDRAAPASPKPGTMLTTPGGNPASSKISASMSAVSGGVCSAGLRMTVLPAASAGASFHDDMSSGKFQGTIRPHTPIGSRSV